MSSFSIGQMNQLGDALERVGFIADDVTKLGQFPGLADLRGVFYGTHEIKPVVRAWREEKGVIYLTLVSEGWSGAQWEHWFDEHASEGYRLSGPSRQLLQSPDFRPSQAGTKHQVAILKGDQFTDADRITSNICVTGQKRGWLQGRDISPEISCLFRRAFSNEAMAQMGLIWIITMHEVIDIDGSPSRLAADRLGGAQWLCAYWGGPDGGWLREHGFAFLVPQARPNDPSVGQVAS